MKYNKRFLMLASIVLCAQFGQEITASSRVRAGSKRAQEMHKTSKQAEAPQVSQLDLAMHRYQNDIIQWYNSQLDNIEKLFKKHPFAKDIRNAKKWLNISRDTLNSIMLLSADANSEMLAAINGSLKGGKQLPQDFLAFAAAVSDAENNARYVIYDISKKSAQILSRSGEEWSLSDSYSSMDELSGVIKSL